MVRQIVTPTKKDYTLILPDEMVGQQIEILAFTTREASTTDKSKNLSGQTEVRAIFDGVRVDLTSFKFNRDEANDYE